MGDFPDRESQWAQREELSRAWAIVDNQTKEIEELEKRHAALVEAAGDIAYGGWVDVDGETGDESCHWCDQFPKHHADCPWVALRAAIEEARK
jgi:hypothetical protein